MLRHAKGPGELGDHAGAVGWVGQRRQGVGVTQVRQGGSSDLLAHALRVQDSAQEQGECVAPCQPRGVRVRLAAAGFGRLPATPQPFGVPGRRLRPPRGHQRGRGHHRLRQGLAAADAVFDVRDEQVPGDVLQRGGRHGAPLIVRHLRAGIVDVAARVQQCGERAELGRSGAGVVVLVHVGARSPSRIRSASRHAVSTSRTTTTASRQAESRSRSRQPRQPCRVAAVNSPISKRLTARPEESTSPPGSSCSPCQ